VAKPSAVEHERFRRAAALASASSRCRGKLAFAVQTLRPSLLAVVPFLAAFLGCTEDHSLLAPTSSSATSGAGGTTSGTTGDTTSSGGQGGQGGATSSSSSSSAVGGAEPSGPTKLTILNGINDYDAIRVCFVPYPSGAAVNPWPASPGGLGFSKATVVDPPDSIAPSGGDVQPFVIGGDLSAIEGMSCDQALALAAGGSGGSGGASTGSGGAGGGGAGGSGAGGSITGTGGTGAGAGGGEPPVPPPIVVGAMPVIPGSVFTSEKSLLLVFFGCLGGPGHTDGTEGLGCGFAYKPDMPTASLTLVAMSRKKEPDRLALQFVHASASMQPSDIRVTPGFDAAVDVNAVKALALGGLGPKPPFVDLTRVDFGPLTKAALKTYAPNDIYPTSALFLQDAFVNGAVKDTAFVDGSSFTIVAIGGYPGVNIQSFWHPFTYTMIASDP